MNTIKEKCIFCLIVEKKINSEILIDNEKSLSFLDSNPLSKGHSLIITKKHYNDLFEIDQNDWNDLFFTIKELVEKIKNQYSPKGFNFVSNIGKEAYQTINHLHIHLIPKYDKESGFIWPSENK
ncbi:MAG: Protein hit [Mycoplasmataceae bacterium]|nr:MAG: Protein hit [Mycoplasmataceae bacterium]